MKNINITQNTDEEYKYNAVSGLNINIMQYPDEKSKYNAVSGWRI